MIELFHRAAFFIDLLDKSIVDIAVKGGYQLFIKTIIIVFPLEFIGKVNSLVKPTASNNLKIAHYLAVKFSLNSIKEQNFCPLFYFR
ncbi:hypothetical protein VIBC2010_00979 [Vibrio caribbeanicus ATCC BAA-2122]|uniref:Uncharacterized protein n=1 Tax=Vibrio caribbeanicus ATCC BAA-2122 TaxID=796620 RepID=E3BGL7_9VIBR|nr:hypothetical protein VIBC2010_00979 [Vibrio caribbeanicus ATCC BAA-2122]